MKKIVLAIAIFASAIMVQAKDYSLSNSVTISTIKTTIAVLKNEASSITAGFIKSVHLSTDLACTFYVYANANDALTGSSTLGISSKSLGESFTGKLQGWKTTVGNSTLNGTLLYQISLPANGSADVPADIIKNAIVGSGDKLVVEALGAGAGTDPSVTIAYRE